MPNVYQFKDFEGSSHRILIRLITTLCPKGGTLLDLGAAGGELGEALRTHFDKTIGFELDRNRIGDLRARFDQPLIANLEEVSRLPRGMSAIVLADVLEHLRSGPQILGLVRDALAPDGTLFISVPNIANVTIRVGLFFGIFRYRDRGILDSTHLRFYTVRTIIEELEAAGFEVTAVHGSSVPIRLIVGPYVPEPLLLAGEHLLTWVTRAWKALFAYQVVLVARLRRS